MRIGKLSLALFLGALPASAVAQPGINVGVGVNVNAGVDADDSYDATAPGDPVESVDVFYDQLSPYGVWVDEPDAGRVFIPETADYVPYNNGHWQYSNLGFVWVSSEPHAWATAHYGRWAYSNNFGRWYWRPDTEWGPAWVQWRQTGTHFGWAPLAPEVVVRAGWQPPVESWHYCGSEHILDVNVTRYYEPRARIVEIHREARPIEHYSTVSNVRVVVGPPAAALREHHMVVSRVKVEARTVGRWTPAEAHAQVERARDHRATFEVQNEHRLEANTRIHAAQTKVIESHPQIKVQINARVQAGGHVEPNRNEPNRPGEPNRNEPARKEPNRPEPNRVESNRPGEPNRPGTPNHTEPARKEPNQPNRVEPNRPGEPNRNEPARKEPNRPEPSHATPARTAPVEHAPTPRSPEHVDHTPVQHPAPAQHEPPHPAPQPAQHEPPHPAPAPQHAEPAPQHAEPARGGERKEPERKEPERKEPERKEAEHR